MNFLNEILHRPGNERPFRVLVVGYPAENAVVPDLSREAFENIATFVCWRGKSEGFRKISLARNTDRQVLPSGRP